MNNSPRTTMLPILINGNTHYMPLDMDAVIGKVFDRLRITHPEMFDDVIDEESPND